MKIRKQANAQNVKHKSVTNATGKPIPKEAAMMSSKIKLKVGKIQ